MMMAMTIDDGDDDVEDGDDNNGNDDKTAPSMSTLTNNIINFSINSHS